jgi:hypothetical protein
MSILRVDSLQLNSVGNAGISIANTWNVTITSGGRDGLAILNNGDVIVNNRMFVAGVNAAGYGITYTVNTALEVALAQANLALVFANATNGNVIVAAYGQANSAYAQANIASASNPVANGAYNQANLAFAQANLGGNKLGATGFFNFNDVELGEDINIWTKNYNVSNILANTTLSTITANGHNFVVNDVVQFTSTGATPNAINTNTNYYILTTTPTANTLQISKTRAGAVLNVQNIGTGIITIYKPVNASAVGPVILANGFTINVATGSTLAVL